MRGRSPYRRPMIRAAMRRRATGRIAIGVALLIFGIVLSFADARAFGGRVSGFLTVRWVLIVLGLLGIVRGLMILSRSSRFR